ncbi:phospho-sugar mutase [Rhodococcus sp. IEGM 1408]|uniref:phospho-sugar mutase n=1 Tax=Rhodococcus sp. IEGM 1408 TaxID=3082220 RepID=UPI0029551C0B|nr:phospho-sugar mutase [Rhodococcus sp. IEGM 1408]MDV8000911.1 phospho-sugar mutase [Rhodococcus sp. IEGM 1408]
MTLAFGTAGVRAPLGPGPDRMNDVTVALVATAVARHLRGREPAGSTVIVGGDARHGSARFVEVAAAVLAAHGFLVVVPGSPVPTPVVAAAVRSRGAVAGLMVTASHNPATDNGIKVFGPGGAQIVPPDDSDIERHLVAAAREGLAVGAAGGRSTRGGSRERVDPGVRVNPSVRVDPTLVDDYVASVVAGLPTPGRPPRVALTPVHGVGGEICRRVLAGIGVLDVTLVAEQADPDPDFPTVDSPNPERPATTARLLELAAEIGADVALALDPDADRCAVGLAGPDGVWRMLDGDDAGALLADHLLTHPLPGSASSAGAAGAAAEDDPGAPIVASTIVSSRLPSLLVPARGGQHVETLTGFKWLVRAGQPLRYAYEEAIGHCVLPEVVADKDGISAAGAWCAMVGAGGPSVGARLDALAEEFGAHLRRNTPLPLDPGSDPVDALRRAADRLASTGVVTPLDGTAGFRVDLPGARAVVRPSGTEPLLKTYVEAWTPARPSAADRGDAARRLTELAGAVAAAATP